MKIYTLIGGINGVGKSSLSGVLSVENSDLGIIIDVDKITRDAGGARIKGGKIAVDKIGECLQRGVNFTQETTLSGIRPLKTIKASKKLDYFIRLYYVGINSFDESIARIKNRVKKGGHNIADADVERRFYKRYDDLIKVLPFCDEVTFFDNENGFVGVAEYKNGKLNVIGDYTPLWIKELKEHLM